MTRDTAVRYSLRFPTATEAAFMRGLDYFAASPKPNERESVSNVPSCRSDLHMPIAFNELHAQTESDTTFCCACGLILLIDDPQATLEGGST